MTGERLRTFLASIAVSCCGAVHAATITIVNMDSPGEGFNDNTPAVPVDGNPGLTRGAQRLHVFQHAAGIWGRLLKSDVEIKVSGSMPVLSGCGSVTVTLGQAGPEGSAADFANAPRPNRSYPAALANALAGTDLDTGKNDLIAKFNSGLDSGTCIQGTVGWWYGVNDPKLVPTDRVPLLPVVFHEIGHGLGFSSGVVMLFGIPVALGGTPIWFDFLYDLEEAKHWSAMSSLGNSIKNDPNLVWSGTNVNRYQHSFLGAPLVGTVNAPAAIAGEFGALQSAQFGPPVGAGGLTGDVVLVDDGVAGAAQGGFPAGTATDGCEAPFTNAAAVAGKIVLMDRGYCSFPHKVKNAQNAGAIGVIVANTAVSAVPAGMGGMDPTITIPSVGVTKAQGTKLQNNLAGLNVTLGLTTGTAGTQGGCVRMFAPDPVAPGSSASHFHVDAYPNVLMEPALNRSLFAQVDLTVELFRDIGWQTERDDVLFADQFDKNPCPVNPAP